MFEGSHYKWVVTSVELLSAYVNSCLLWCHGLGETGTWTFLSYASKSLSYDVTLHGRKISTEYSLYPSLYPSWALFLFSLAANSHWPFNFLNSFCMCSIGKVEAEFSAFLTLIICIPSYELV